MRLLNTKTLELTSFAGEVPEYVILSHRWEKEEILFEDVSKLPLSSLRNPAREKLGLGKVMGTCNLAVEDGYEWVWIDSCCIDKSSSAELQESINSMFRWYQQAEICYAYLSDVLDKASGWNEAFERSQWFTRGWTLQELLAPYNVEFYSADWSPIGTKLCRTKQVADITGIETAALDYMWGTTEDNFCAAQKFSWASRRLVSKAEDSAYCLFGLFNVNMPLLYGEGEIKAFHRLQRAIYEESADHTLFLFARSRPIRFPPILASTATEFCRKSDCLPCTSAMECFPSNVPYSEIIPRQALWPAPVQDAYYIRFVRQGVMVKLPLVKYNARYGEANLSRDLAPLDDKFIAILPLSRRGHENCLFGIILKRLSSTGYIRMGEVPALLDADMLQIDGQVLGAYTVYNEIPLDTSFGLSPRPGTFLSPSLGFAQFAFHSRWFKCSDWICETQIDTLFSTDTIVNFPMPEQECNHFTLAVAFQGTVDKTLTGYIVLWYSKSGIGLREIVSSQNGHDMIPCDVRPDKSVQECLRSVVPIGKNGDLLKVVLRRTPVSRDLFAANILKYRLDVTFMSQQSQKGIL